VKPLGHGKQFQCLGRRIVSRSEAFSIPLTVCFSRGQVEKFPGLTDLLVLLKYVAHEKTVTFVYAACDDDRNSAVALKQFLERGKK
jgi:hypothetical protein